MYHTFDTGDIIHKETNFGRNQVEDAKIVYIILQCIYYASFIIYNSKYRLKRYMCLVDIFILVLYRIYTYLIFYCIIYL